MKRFYLILLLVVISALIANAETNPNKDKKLLDYVKILLGSWQCDKDKTIFIMFENTKATSTNLFSDGITVLHVKYEPENKITLRNIGMEYTLIVKVNGESLTTTDATNPEATSIFHKLKGVPKELELKPFLIGKPANLTPDKLKSIRDELIRRRELDQSVRTNPDKAKDMKEVDANNTEYLQKLVKEIGWIDAKRFGKEVATAAFLIVQHSGDLFFMMGVLPYIEKDVKAKEAEPQDYALLYDRVHLMTGGKQRYGSQLTTNKQGESVVYPLEDRNKVEQFRKEIGLFPLSTYLDIYKQKAGVKEIKFMEDWDD